MNRTSSADRRITLTFVLAGLAALTGAAPAAAQAPLGAAFTYQGRLEASGVPASGSYDMVFALYDAAAGGNLVATRQNCGATTVPVTDGLFTAELDFGAGVFDGRALWLEVRVRPATGGCQGCGGGCPYTTLTPRQPVLTAPYALHALGGPWAADGTAIVNSNQGFVGVNRTQPVTAAEAFGVYKNTTSYGGMYVQTEASGRPFYGYSTGGGVDAYHYIDGVTGSWHVVNGASGGLTLTESGNVGIGTTTPGATLDVAGLARIEDAVFQEQVVFSGGAQVNGRLGINGVSNGGPTDHSLSIYAQTAGQTVRAQNDGAGKAGEFIIGSASNALYAVEGKTAGTGVAVHGHTTGNGWAGYFVNRSATNSKAALYCRTDGTGLAFQADGVARMDVLEITGADVAERFPVSETEAIAAGAVMEIDPDNPGMLRVARGAYNRRVAGVVSGAGDVPVGAILGNLPGHEDAPPIALSGRVWVQCDAGGQAIAVGDLLTTADTPGHAMKAVERDRSHGAVIGKAMSALPAGQRGLVLVLVNLQ